MIFVAAFCEFINVAPALAFGRSIGDNQAY